MKLIDGLLNYRRPWSLPDVYLFTGNSTIKNNGAIVMGRGAAKEVRDTYKDIDQSFGMILLKAPNLSLAWVSVKNRQTVGWFKVKDHWKEPAKLSIIKTSVEALNDLAIRKKATLFHINYPGIGNGGLEGKTVLPLLQVLPDNVLIYK